MINFNEVYYKSVQKEAVAWTESLSTMLFDLPRDGLEDLKIPLSPSNIQKDMARVNSFKGISFN